jgi:Surp module protein
MILPPPDLRSFISKTASFVRKNGKPFEDKIKEREKGNPKFTFLFTTDPYHPYYASLLEDPFFSEKVHVKHEHPVIDTPNPDPHISQRAAFLTTLQTVSPLDLALMRLVAKYLLANGQIFMVGLFSKESSNHLFDFLKPLNSLNPVFKSLVEQYGALSNYDQGESTSSDTRKALASQLCVKDHHASEGAKNAHPTASVDRLVNFDVFSLVDFFDANTAPSSIKPIGFAEFASLANTHRIALWTGPAGRNNESTTTHIVCSICLSHVSADKYAEHVRNELFRSKAEHVLK